MYIIEIVDNKETLYVQNCINLTKHRILSQLFTSVKTASDFLKKYDLNTNKCRIENYSNEKKEKDFKDYNLQMYNYINSGIEYAFSKSFCRSLKYKYIFNTKNNNCLIVAKNKEWHHIKKFNIQLDLIKLNIKIKISHWQVISPYYIKQLELNINKHFNNYINKMMKNNDN